MHAARVVLRSFKAVDNKGHALRIVVAVSVRACTRERARVALQTHFDFASASAAAAAVQQRRLAQ
jgi:hypothetical protein